MLRNCGPVKQLVKLDFKPRLTVLQSLVVAPLVQGTGCSLLTINSKGISPLFLVPVDSRIDDARGQRAGSGATVFWCESWL